MSDESFTPDEKFSLYPLTGEEVARRLLAGEGADEADMEPEPEDEAEPE